MDIWSLWAVALPFIYRLKLYTFFFNEIMMLPSIDSDLLYRGALWDRFDCILFNKAMVRNSTTLGWIFRHGHFWRYQRGWQRMTDNTMAKRTRTNNDLQNIIQKTKDRSKQTTLKTRGAFRCSRRGKQFLLHKWQPLYYSCYKPKAWLIFWSTTFTFYTSQNITVLHPRLLIV
jgi:hypothetical protein